MHGFCGQSFAVGNDENKLRRKMERVDEKDVVYLFI